jgi:D-3-phosphoglycerate dehydrogenase
MYYQTPMKLQILNNIAKEGLDTLEGNGFHLHKTDAEDDYLGIVLRSFNLRDLPLRESLLGIARAGAGTNNINVDECSKHGVVVFNTPGANANAVKELVICSLILSKRDILNGNTSINLMQAEDLSEEELSKKVETVKKQFVGNEIKGKSIGIVGLGAIGSLVAEQALALGLNVKGFDPGLTVETAIRLPGSIKHNSKIEDTVKDVDYVSLHLPLNKSTSGFFNEKILATVSQGTTLINFSRGGIINEEDVLSALDSGKLEKYVTDFPTKKLISRLRNENDVLIFPHLGASTKESEVNCAVMACNQLKNFIKDGQIENSVNFPNISSLKRCKHRFFIANVNEPGIISLITETIAEEKINISEFVNKSRQDVACNIIDTDDEISVECLTKLRDIKGVTKVRICY